MTPKTVIKSLLKQTGFELVKLPGRTLENRMKLLRTQGINLVLDAGANIGQYAGLLREIGYDQRIVSFEPLSAAYATLKAAADKDPNWEAVNVALGDMDGEIEINIAGGSSTSSSILDMLPAHTDIKPESAYVGKEPVSIYRLDTLFERYYRPGDKVLLKIDTQGYEKNVLEGAYQVLPYIQGVQLEMSLAPLYEGEMLYQEMIAYLAGLGFTLFSVEPGFTDKRTGRLLQMDGIFFRD
jgi:FkbM family methyltransferase